jgi:hypothetical protein
VNRNGLEHSLRELHPAIYGLQRRVLWSSGIPGEQPLAAFGLRLEMDRNNTVVMEPGMGPGVLARFHVPPRSPLADGLELLNQIHQEVLPVPLRFS